MTKEFDMDFDGEQWHVTVEGSMADGMGPTKRDWLEEAIRRHFPGEMEGDHPLHSAGDIFQGPSGEVEIAIDYDGKDKEVTVVDGMPNDSA